MSQTTIVELRGRLDEELRAGDSGAPTIRRSLICFVELAQNVQRYSSETERLGKIAVGIGAISVREDEMGITLETRNRLDTRRLDETRAKFLSIASVPRTGLDERFRALRRKSEAPSDAADNRSAGLGLIEIARMSDIGLQWSIQTKDDRHDLSVVSRVGKGMDLKRYELDRGSDTLGVVCDPQTGDIVLEGSSYPEDAFSFFEPIQTWVGQYLSINPKRLRLECTIDYLNSSSSKCLFDLLDSIEKNAPAECSVEVVWLFDPEDEDSKLVGEEFAEDVDLDFTFKAKD